jgi:hypothetical protein
MTPADWQRLGFTSGRRTYLGNKKVGGVANSDHLTGSAADFTAPLSAVRARFPNARILDEGDHRHVSGLSDVPYHGKRGTIGLVNGVDTTAPKGTAMIRPRKPQPKMAAMQQPVPMPMRDPYYSGPDPLAPMPEAPSPLAAALAPVAPQADPLAPLPGGDPKKKGGIFGSGLNGWDLLGIAADGYLLANGQQGAYTQGKRQEREMQFDREKFNQELEAKREAAMQPRLEQVGNAIGMVDPSTGQFTPTYPGPESQTSLQQNIAELRRLKPDITDEEVAAIIQQNITNPIMPRMVTYAQGDQTITEQINPDGSRKPVASAPRWAPPKAPAGPRASGPPAGFILD